MKTTKKNIYLAALGRAITDDVELDQVLRVIGGRYESDAYCWIEEGRTEKEIVALLRKIGYDIPKDFIGSETVKFNSTIQED